MQLENIYIAHQEKS